MNSQSQVAHSVIDVQVHTDLGLKGPENLSFKFRVVFIVSNEKCLYVKFCLCYSHWFEVGRTPKTAMLCTFMHCSGFSNILLLLDCLIIFSFQELYGFFKMNSCYSKIIIFLEHESHDSRFSFQLELTGLFKKKYLYGAPIILWC